jgi:hypothetical protein
MRYSARLELARHGFESVTLNLAEAYQDYKEVLARHGIPISRRLVIGELAEIRESGYDPEVIRQVLEKRSAACTGEGLDGLVCTLGQTLGELELLLENLASDLAYQAAHEGAAASENGHQPEDVVSGQHRHYAATDEVI